MASVTIWQPDGNHLQGTLSPMTQSTKDPLQFPLLRNLQFSPIKEHDEQ
jgi:hypothetical protein